MEIAQVLIYACAAGAFFGSGYLWKTAPAPQKLIAPKGAENMPFSVVLILQLNSLQDELQDCNNEKRRLFLKTAIGNKLNEIDAEPKRNCANGIDFVQGVIGVYEYNQHRLSIGEKPLPLEEKEVDLLRNMGKMPQLEIDTVLDLQPLSAAAIKKKSKFDRLKTRFLARPKVVQFVFDCAVFWESTKRCAVSIQWRMLDF